MKRSLLARKSIPFENICQLETSKANKQLVIKSLSPNVKFDGIECFSMERLSPEEFPSHLFKRENPTGWPTYLLWEDEMNRAGEDTKVGGRQNKDH